MEHPHPAEAPSRRRSRHGTWRKVPFAMVRTPATLIAVFGAAFVLGLAAASAHLFLSSAGTSSLGIAVRGTSPTFAGLSAWLDGPISSDRVRFRTELLREAAGGVQGLRGLSFSAVDGTVLGVGPYDDRFTVPSVRLATREGFHRHISVVAGDPQAPGWWVPKAAATRAGLRPGDMVEVNAGTFGLLPGAGGFGQGFVPSAQGARLPVAGIYRELFEAPLDDFWDPLYREIFGDYPSRADIPPPPFLLADPETFLALEDRFAGFGRMVWELPVDTSGLTLPQATDLADRVERIEGTIDEPATQLGGSFAEHDSGLRSLLEEADGTVASLTGPIQAVAIAGRVVALGLFVGAGVHALTRRRIELTMLTSRGVGAGTLGARAAVEATIPSIGGAVAGWAAAGPLLRVAGPGGAVDPSASSTALVDTLATAAVGLVLLVAVTGLALRGSRERRPGRLRRFAARLPWEVVPLALAAAAFYEIRSHGAGPVDPEAGAGVDPLVPLFPIAFVAALTGLGLRAAVRLLPRIRGRAQRWPAAAYMAVGRVATAPRPATALVAGAALAVGVVAYSAVFTSSVQATVATKVQVSVGSDASLRLPGPVELPADLPERVTEVVRMPVARLGGGTTVAVLGIDPETFSRGAGWRPGFASRPLEEVLSALTGPAGDAAPVVATASLPENSAIEFFTYELPIRLVAQVDGFPGMRPGAPLVIASTEQLDRVAQDAGLTLDRLGAVHELWVQGDSGPVVRALERARIFPTAVVTLADVAARPELASISWLFGFLQALGLLTGLLALAAVLLYVESRQRARVASYVLASRMGLSRRSHRRSIVIELVVMLLLAFVLGVALAALGAYMIHGDVDPLPDLPPAALFRVPLPALGALGASLLAFAVAAAWVAQRRADRANAAEVMRLAG